MLKDTQAYVFVGKGEERNVYDTFNRTSEIVLDDKKTNVPGVNDLTWEIVGSDIASLDNRDGGLWVYGKKFGQTFLVGTDNNVKDKDDNVVPKKYYFAIFVSPSVTVLSPEGAVYKYYKTYFQPARISLTQSKDYAINCVMKYTSAGPVDVTELVAADEKEDNDGYYVSDDPVDDDIKIVISEESRQAGDNFVVGSSGVKLQVVGSQLYFKKYGASDGEYDYFDGYRATISDVNGKNSVDVATEDGYNFQTNDSFDIKNGVFLVKIYADKAEDQKTDEDKRIESFTFKIIVDNILLN